MRKGIILLAATTMSVAAMAQNTYKALKFKTATSLFNYEMMTVHEQNLARTEKWNEAVKSKETMTQYIRSLRERFTALAGPLPPRGELKAQKVGTVKGNGFTVEKIIFQSIPGRYVTAHLYLPENVKGKKPVCIEMCGHGLDGKGDGSMTAEMMAVNGIAVMVVDPFSQGERQQTIDASGKNLTRGVTTEHTLIAPAFLLLGTSLAAQEYFDNSRAIDYLLTRKDIDREKIGCYGFSGGGTQSAYLIGLDDRIKAGSVGLFFSSRERTLETQGPSDGCQWMPYEGREHIEIADMAMMNAPKPFLVLDGVFDFVDHWGALQGFKEVQQCYATLGYPERVEQFYYQDGHAAPEESLVKMVQFFQQAFNGKVSEVKKVDYWRGEDMRCTKSGQVNLEYQDAMSVMQECKKQMDDLAEARKTFCQRPITEIREKIKELLGLSEKQKSLDSPLITNYSQTKHTTLRDGEEYYYQLDSPGEYPVPVIVRIPSDATSSSKICIHLSDAGKGVVLTEQDRRDAVSDGTIHLYADLRGYGETADIFSQNLSKYWNTQYRTVVTALHAGRPMMGQRVQDLITIMNFCSEQEKLKGHPIIVEADGANGVVAAHGTVLDERIQQTTLTRSLKSWTSYIENPMQYDMMPNILVGVLQYYDITDLVTLSQGRVKFED